MSGGSFPCVHVVALGGLQWTDGTPHCDTSERRARRCDCKLLYTVHLSVYLSMLIVFV